MAIPPDAYGYPDAEITADKLPIWQQPLARFTVDGPDDWRVSALASIDRGIRVEIGTGSGDAVTDVTHEYETMSLPKPDIPLRHYLIVRRRNWSGDGTSTLVAIPGSAKAELPKRSNKPGEESDQPLALVPVSQAETTVGKIIDLRTFAHDGGVEVVDKLALKYLETPGAAVKLGMTLYRYEAKGNGVWDWGEYPFRVDGIAYTPNWTGLEYRGDTFVSKGMYWVNGDRITVQAMFQSGAKASLGLGVVGFSLPPGVPAGKDFLQTGVAVANTSGTGGLNHSLFALVGPDQAAATIWADRSPMITPGRAGIGWGANSSFHVQLEYRR